MKGKIAVSVKNKHISFKLELERNITIITGDSGTGKTKLINMIRAYSTEGKSSGVTLKCDRPCVVLEGINWEIQLESIKESVVFIEESTKFLPTYDFASAIQNTDNYYVFITREPLPQISYSIDSVKRIVKNGIKPKIEKIYSKVGVTDITKKKYDVIIIEDAKAGYQFFSKVGEVWKALCISAGGKSNILNALNKQKADRILVIADAAAFGSEIRDLMQFISSCTADIDLFMPESFEWLILKSAIFGGHANVQEILANPVEYIESKEYFSWERFFTQLLVTESKDSPKLKYPKSKSKLPSGYLTETNIDNIINAMK